MQPYKTKTFVKLEADGSIFKTDCIWYTPKSLGNVDVASTQDFIDIPRETMSTH